REVLATVLLKEGKATDALRGFEAVLTKEPNRYRALTGAMQAAERAGDSKKAASLAERVIEQTAAADGPRPEITQARRVLGRYAGARRREAGDRPNADGDRRRRLRGGGRGGRDRALAAAERGCPRARRRRPPPRREAHGR